MGVTSEWVFLIVQTLFALVGTFAMKWIQSEFKRRDSQDDQVRREFNREIESLRTSHSGFDRRMSGWEDSANIRREAIARLEAHYGDIMRQLSELREGQNSVLDALRSMGGSR